MNDDLKSMGRILEEAARNFGATKQYGMGPLETFHYEVARRLDKLFCTPTPQPSRPPEWFFVSEGPHGIRFDTKPCEDYIITVEGFHIRISKNEAERLAIWLLQANRETR